MCTLFGQEICREGFCMNTQPGFECYCKQGFYYDGALYQCLDVDECQDEQSCPNSHCVNTNGSYSCVCPPPMVFDPNKRQPLASHPTAPVAQGLDPSSHPTAPVAQGLDLSPRKPETWVRFPGGTGRNLRQVYSTHRPELQRDKCWKNIGNNFMCSYLAVGHFTTFPECCCKYGQAWGSKCQLCPALSSELHPTVPPPRPPPPSPPSRPVSRPSSSVALLPPPPSLTPPPPDPNLQHLRTSF
uniref:TB domain-containing protein n=1 Tax=Callorhinchus milii TaxID=7868 RepID=A0A4W3H170_CALMI